MSKKQEAESDSDWDSLPGDIPNGGSTPEPAKSPSSQVPTHSPVPAPPKQPYSRHPTPAKPINMALYKNTSKRVQKAGNATTFEDKTGGISLLNDDNPNDGIHDSFSMESNNNFMKNKNDAVKENKDTTKKRNVQVEQRKNKKPPFTDFQGLYNVITIQSLVKNKDVQSEYTNLYIFPEVWNIVGRIHINLTLQKKIVVSTSCLKTFINVYFYVHVNLL